MNSKARIESLTFVRADGRFFQVGPAALQIMRQYIQNAPEKSEAGGVLLGRHILGTHDIIVDAVTAPLPGDRRSRLRFFRAHRLHQMEIDRIWRESNGTCTYLGEWHTHPEEDPVPSLIDRRGWQQKLQIDKFTEPIFFVIIGIAKTCVWEGYHNGYLTPTQQLQAQEALYL